MIKILKAIINLAGKAAIQNFYDQIGWKRDSGGDDTERAGPLTVRAAGSQVGEEGSPEARRSGRGFGHGWQ